MAFTLGEYQDIFLEEADEQLQELNQNLLKLEKNPGNTDLINDIFRAAHSLKSSAAFVGLNDLSDLAHKMENLLQGIRDGNLSVTPSIIDVIFKCFDEINSVIETIASGEEPTQDLNWLIVEIQKVSSGIKQPSKKETADQSVKKENKVSNVPDTTLSEDEKKDLVGLISGGAKGYELTVFVDETAKMKWVKAQLILSNLGRLGDIIKTIPSIEDLSDDAMNNIFKIFICSNNPLDMIRSACNVDLIFRVDLKEINIAAKGDDKALDFGAASYLIGEESIKEFEEGNSKSTEESGSADIETSIGIDEFRDDDDEHHDIHFGRRASDQADESRKKAHVTKTVKVAIDKLDQLLNNVGELVIANSGFYKLYEEVRRHSGLKSIANEFKNRMEGMSRIAKDLQTGIMKTRMVEIGGTFSRFNRLVRDLSKEHNKKIELIINGEDTELDKKVIDVIGEPLMHLIRNSVDHGVETPEERVKNGKPELARITLNSYQGGNHIFVEVSDDGKGMDVEVIKRKALEKGLSTAEAIANMDDTEIYNFIFAAGFSTAKKVTDVSGRGVGMNVVKNVVNELNGSVNIDSEPGMGTRFVLTFPLTLAIIPAIMVRVRRELYAIPLSDVIETIKISQSDITTIEGHEVINLRGEILSLLRLDYFINLKSALTKNDKVPVVVVGFGNRKIGLLVDILEGKLEIVIKSLEQNYKTVEGLAGASILGDGSICLILDIATMINKVISDQDKLTHLHRQGMLEGKVEEIGRDSYEKSELIDLEGKYIEKPEAGEDDAVIYDEGEKPAVLSSRDTILFDNVEETKPEVSGEPAGQADAMPVGHETQEPGITVSGTSVTDAGAAAESIKETSTEETQSGAVSDDSDSGISQESTAAKVEAKQQENGAADISDTISPPDDLIDEKNVENGGDVRNEVYSTLENFRKELKENVSSTLSSAAGSEVTEDNLDITREDLNEFQLVANIGATVAAESLSRILSKRIDLSIPEVVLKPIEKIPDYLGNMSKAYLGVMMPMMGDIKGTVLFALDENMGFELIDSLYGTSVSNKKELDDDGISALTELTNIIGSSIINVIADKTGFTIMPDVPSIVHDFLQSIIDSILIVQNIQNDYAVVMDTAFFFQDDKQIGNLIFFPESESLSKLIDGLRANVGSN